MSIPFSPTISTPRGKIAFIAAIGLLSSLNAHAQRAVSADVSSLEYEIITGTSSTRNGVTYSGNVAQITSFTTGSEIGGNLTVYQPIPYTGDVTTYLRRNLSSENTAPHNDIGFYFRTAAGEGGSTNSVHGIYAPQEQLFNANNLYSGTDNLFTNTGNGDQNNNNIERLDVIFSEGLTVTESLAFLILERGAANGHDGFQIAAITSLTAPDTVGSFGDLVTFNASSYGLDNLFPDGDTRSTVVRDSIPYTSGGASTVTTTAQRIGGTTIAVFDDGDTLTKDLGITLGSVIYGYSLFAIDVDPSRPGADLLDITSSAYPTNTADTAGGIDLIAYTGVAVYSIPEPTTWASLGMGAALLAFLKRRRNSKA